MRGPLLLLSLLFALAAGVQAQEDGPTLEGLDFVQNRYQGGDRIDVEITVHHEEGVRSLSLVLIRPDGDEMYPDLCTRGNLDADDPPKTGRNTCQFQLPRAVEPGEYVVDRVYVNSGVQQPLTLVRGEDWHASSGIEDRVRVDEAPPDTTPPELVSIDIQPQGLEAGENVTITVAAEDEIGLNRTLMLIDDGSGGSIVGDCLVPGEGVFEIACEVQVPETAPGGAYSIRWIELHDTQGNTLRMERGKGLTPSEQVVIGFHVTERYFDVTPPVLLSYVTPDAPLRVGDDVEVLVRAKDDVDIASMSVVFMSMETGTSFPSVSCGPLENPADATCTAVLSKDFPLGRYRVFFISIKDSAGNQQGYPVGLPPLDAADREALLDDIGFTLLPGTLRTTGGPGEGLVAGLAPASEDAVPGTVVTFVVVPGEGHTLQNVSFRLATAEGALLGMQDCSADTHPLPGGFRCRMLVPPDAPEALYRLEELRVRADGGDWQPVELAVDHAPRLFVGSSAPGLDAVPEDWADHVQGGITLPGFQDVAPAPPVPRTSSTAPVDGNVTSPGTQDSPGTWLGGLLALCLVAVHRRARRRAGR